MDARGGGEGGGGGGSGSTAGDGEARSAATPPARAMGEAAAPRWSKAWVDPLRSGDIFTRSWASPLPVRARRSSFPQSPGAAAAPGPSASPLGGAVVYHTTVASGATVAGSPIGGASPQGAGRATSSPGSRRAARWWR